MPDIGQIVANVVASAAISIRAKSVHRKKTESSTKPSPDISQESKILGGISLEYARDLLHEFNRKRFAHPNLFAIGVASPIGVADTERIAKLFALFALSVDYTPTTLEAESRQIGSAMSSVVKARELVEIRITTYDDQEGSLKKWFRELDRVACPKDGTVGLPSQYATAISIIHAFGDDSEASRSGYKDVYPYCRPVSIEVGTLDRSARGEHQKLTMTFAEIAPFMS